MKKFFLLLAAALLAAPLMAQEFDGPDGLDKDNLEDSNLIWSQEAADGHNLLEVRAMSHLSYDFLIVSSNDFEPNRGGSGELDINVLEFGILPTPWMEISLGADFLYRFIGSKTHVFNVVDPGRRIQAAPLVGTYEKARSTIDCFGIGFPALLTLRFGNFSLTGGIEANLLWGNTNIQNKTRYQKNEIRNYEAGINLFTYDIVAALSFYRMGVLFKYTPASSPLLPEGSTDLRYWSIGMVFGF